MAKLYDICKDRMVKGEIIEAVSNKKIVFGLQSTRVTLDFDEEDEGGSSVVITHERLNTDALIKSHRLNWEQLTTELGKELKAN